MHLRLLTLLCVIPLLGCSAEPDAPPAIPRAVSFVTLEVREPAQGNRLTGTVESWKREDLGFEVAGRLLSIVEPGVDIVGRTLDEEGNLLSEGTVLARLDSERYELAKTQAQTAAEAARTDLEEVVPQMLAEAEAALVLADRELQRYTNLVATQSASQQRLDVAETAQRAAAAKVAQVEALRATKAALLSSSLAAVDQAERNIADCVLRSPFSGQIARVQIIPGGYALPGQPVLTVQMMDPMKVQLAVSPEVDKRLNFNDRLRVYLPDHDDWVSGLVYLKDTYADPATRTYLVTLLVRNQKVQTRPTPGEGEPEVATTKKLWTLQPEKMGSTEKYYVDVDSLHQDEQGYFVWKVENLTADQLYEDFDQVLQVKKVRVTPGDGRLPALQVFTFRELSDYGGLDPAKDVVVGAVEGEVVEGVVVLTQERWLLRPGDLVEVALRDGSQSHGLYVPRVAILSDGDQPYVVAVSQGTDKSRRVAVRIFETSGQSQRIEAVTPGDLNEGDHVVVGGAHYVIEGEAVSLVAEMETRL